MTAPNNSQNQLAHAISFTKPIVVGAAIALLVISVFVFGTDTIPAEWGRFWRIKPLLVTPLSGAAGGAFYAFMDYQSSRGFNRTLATLLSIVVYVVGLWLGTVLGLAGTMWD